jgi:MFS transporter, DHA2 family, multidrug resistance protein
MAADVADNPLKPIARVAETDVTQATAEQTQFKRVPHHGLITASVMMATIMQAIDSTIANVALPQMQGTLSATQDQMGWVLTSYIVASAITIPLTGWLAGQLGRRRVFLISILLFTISSALCGLASSLPQIVLFRFLQGVGGAALIPLSQAVLFDINPPKDFGRAMSIWGIGVFMGPILGPALGGWLTEDYSWRWVFFINLPIGALAFAGLIFTMPESRNAQSSRFDFFGFTTLALSIAGFQVMLDRGQLLDWFSSTEIIIEASVAAVSFYLFLIHTFSTPSPFLKLSLFKDRNFVIANLLIVIVGADLFATLALTPQLLQEQLQYPVILTGLVMVPRGVGMFLTTLIVGRVVTRIDPRALMASGLALYAFSLVQMTQFSLLMGTWPIIVSGFVQGIGFGLVYVPLAAVAFTTLPSTLRNEGTAFFNLLRSIGASIGISVMTFLLTRNVQRLHASIAEHITPFTDPSSPAMRAAHVTMGTLPGLMSLNATITNQAAMIAYIDDFRVMMLLTLTTFPLLLLIKKTKPAAGGHAVLD